MTTHCTSNLVTKYFIIKPPRNDKELKKEVKEYQHVQRHFRAKYNLNTPFTEQYSLTCLHHGDPQVSSTAYKTVGYATHHWDSSGSHPINT
jgi:hypothetical protein